VSPEGIDEACSEEVRRVLTSGVHPMSLERRRLRRHCMVPDGVLCSQFMRHFQATLAERTNAPFRWNEM
jgi:phosphohistidine phosphatase SixA